MNKLFFFFVLLSSIPAGLDKNIHSLHKCCTKMYYYNENDFIGNRRYFMNIETTYKSNQKRHLKPLHILYLISLFLVVLLLLCIFLTRTQNYNDPTRKNYDDISHLWHLSPDSSEVLDLRNLGNYCDADDKVLYLYCKVPELSHDTTLFFRSKDVYTSLYIDEKKIY